MHPVTGALLPSALALLVAAGAPAAAEDTMTRRAVPADGRIALTDYGYRDWWPELVHYALDTTRFRAGKLVLLDPSGRAVPFQVEGNTLAFVAFLPRGETNTYHLQASPQDRSAENTTLAAGPRGAAYEVRNEHVALRLPPPGTRAFPEPVEAAQATPPLLQWGQVGHGWMGGMRFATPRRVASQAFAVVRSGPACVEYEARYRFTPKGEYVWRVRLSPGMPLAVVTEEYDFGEITEGHDLLMLDLHAGWQPQSIGTVGGAGEQQMPAPE